MTDTETMTGLLRHPSGAPEVAQALAAAMMSAAVDSRSAGDPETAEQYHDLAEWLHAAPLYWGSGDYIATLRALDEGGSPELPVPDFTLAEAGAAIRGIPRLLFVDPATAISVPINGEPRPMIGLLRWADADLEDGYWCLVGAPSGEVGFVGVGQPGRSEQFCRLAFWILDNPDLMEKSTIDAAPRQSKAARRRGKPHTPSPVTIVDLRAPHKKAAAEVAQAERTYRHRWIVRGHWHRFWTGPRNGERKLETRYVMPYVKGPAGAPLNATELVRKW